MDQGCAKGSFFGGCDDCLLGDACIYASIGETMSDDTEQIASPHYGMLLCSSLSVYQFMNLQALSVYFYKFILRASIHTE